MGRQSVLHAPPRLCFGCFQERLARLVVAEGTVARVGPQAAVLRDEDGSAFFWTWISTHTQPPRVGERYAFSYDPDERPQPSRYVVARGVRPVGWAFEVS